MKGLQTWLTGLLAKRVAQVAVAAVLGALAAVPVVVELLPPRLGECLVEWADDPKQSGSSSSPALRLPRPLSFP